MVNYGFEELKCKVYQSQRIFTADEYVEHLGTHCDHIVLKEEYKNDFYEGIRAAIKRVGNRLIMNDEIVLYLCRKGKKGA